MTRRIITAAHIYNIIGLLAFFTITLQISGCGIKLGTNGLNDAEPQGWTVRTSNNFNATSTKEVSGVVTIYEQPGTGNYIVRLSGFSAPNETGLVMIADITGVGSRESTLRAFTGNINYTINLGTTNATFTRVRIRSNPANTDYAIASL